MISAVILAAGRSTRMGRSKALLTLGVRETFVRRIASTFREAGVDEVVVVVGHEATRVAADLQLGAVPVRIVVNHAYDSGQFSSVLAGLDAVDRPDVEAMLLTLVDIPLVEASTVRTVIDRYRSTLAPIVRPVRGHEHGHPVLIARALFSPLRDVDPAVGAKALVRRHATIAGDVEITDAGAFLDIDTPDQYERTVRGL